MRLSDLVVALLWATLAAVPLGISLWALLDAARRPQWAWALAGRRQVVWMAAIMLGTMVDNADLGWSFYEGLKANNAVAVRGNGAVLKSVASGEKAYGVLVDFMALNAKAKGSPVDFVFPAEGVPAVTEPVAILKTTKNEAAAKAFVDFILSDEGQKLAGGHRQLRGQRNRLRLFQPDRKRAHLRRRARSCTARIDRNDSASSAAARPPGAPPGICVSS